MAAMSVAGRAQESPTPAAATSTVQSGNTPAPQPQPPPPAQAFVLKDHSKPHRAFPNLIAPYQAEHVPPPNLANTARLDQLLHDGKILLSIDDAVALALENNLDIAIARYNLSIADTDILRTSAGALILGVNTGILQGTPGGGVGGLSGTVGSGAGGTSVAAGGAATGTAGLVSSTLGLGSTISSFDPIVGGTLQIDRARTLSASSLTGATQIANDTDTADFNYAQGFHWGTNMSVVFNNSRLSTNQPTTTLSPELVSNFKFQLSQHLLQGYGLLPNTRFIRIAQNNRSIADTSFRLQVITTVDQIENIYWDLVYAYENLKVQQEALAFAEKTLSDTQKQVTAGVTAPLQLASAESAVATDQEGLIVAQTNLELQQLLMKNALSRTMVDPVLAEAEVIPTSTMEVPENEQIPPTTDLITDALSHRGELEESRVDLKTREVSERAVANALLPTADVFAYYGGSGLGGDQNPANICPPPAEKQPFGCHPAGAISPIGYGATLKQLVNSSAPDKGAGLTFSVPLRNRLAQANQVRSELEYRQAQMRLQQLENQVRIEVRNAQFTLQQNRAAVAAAKAGVDSAKQSLYAEEKKLQAGMSTAVLVLQNESLVATAQSNLISATAAYEKARLELDRATGLLLEHSNIQIADAKRGQVGQEPRVPSVIEMQELSPDTKKQQ
ncbi:MAG TPA: TolC family protein [Terriglobales bacterium]|nr:TolC family protein [Terriglobales bacterium]